jgi:hypothetical protein
METQMSRRMPASVADRTRRVTALGPARCFKDLPAFATAPSTTVSNAGTTTEYRLSSYDATDSEISVRHGRMPFETASSSHSIRKFAPPCLV